jgi:4-amino-4-deoxy-L-arabinose transferase-like glycosyltransferase
VWEYSLTSLLFTSCFCIAQRIHLSNRSLAWLGWGLLFGLTALANPAVLATLPFLLALALYQVRKSGRPWLAKGALTALAAFAVLVPWTVRNYVKLGIVCPVRDNFWLEFYDENLGDSSLDPSFAHPSSNPAEMRKFLAMGEPAFLAEKKTLAVDYLKKHPEFFVAMTMKRIRYYWTGYWSFSAEELREQPYEPANVFYVTSMTFLMVLGMRRMWRLNRAATLPYAVLFSVFPITYYLTHPLMDYRQPIEPAIVVLAIAGVLALKRARTRQWVLAESDLDLVPEIE